MIIRPTMAGRSRSGIRVGTRSTNPNSTLYSSGGGTASARNAPSASRSIDHHVLIFPNLAIVDNHGIMIRTYFSTKPEEMLVQSWTLAPTEESTEIRRLRLYSYMDFLGPAGFGTPDDVEAIEAAQRGYKGAEDYDGWNDVSAGMAPKDP